ncbi:MAG: hypothetical protein EPN84_00635 [Legionella sp.]|nr:MAG: hypothetical protein EPN84_00635 [Legionella sp.]
MVKEQNDLFLKLQGAAVLHNEFTIANHRIGENTPPYVIAEAGSNFNQNLDTAYKLIDAAANAGANAVKFQLFRADLLYPNGGELHAIFKSIELNVDWLPMLERHAKDCGIQLLSSAFDKSSIDALEALDTPAHKIASSETTDLAFLHYVASKGKPMIISTGMCDMVDVEEAVNVCLSVGNQNVTLLQCGAMYPLPPENANLQVIKTFNERFGCPVGFSDHTLGQVAAIASVGLGATVFEKHFTLDRKSEGPDHFYALEPNELKSYVSSLHEAYQTLGTSVKKMLPKEREQGRREGLYAVRDLSVGEVISAIDINSRRPAIGLRARYANAIIGARVTKELKKDEPITWDLIEF